MAKGVMSQEYKEKFIHDLGFGEKVEDGDWSDVTTGEVGSMIREANKRGEQAIAEEAKANGEVRQNVK